MYFFKFKALEDQLRAMQTLLRENECQSNPCQNGGTCEDLYDAYQCHCTSNWEVCVTVLCKKEHAGILRENNLWRFQGPNCMTDVNECARFLGTDLGCQNGATCRNQPGSYRYVTQLIMTFLLYRVISKNCHYVSAYYRTFYKIQSSL